MLVVDDDAKNEEEDLLYSKNLKNVSSVSPLLAGLDSTMTESLQ